MTSLETCHHNHKKKRETKCDICDIISKNPTAHRLHYFTHAKNYAVTCLVEDCTNPGIKHPGSRNRHFETNHDIIHPQEGEDYRTTPADEMEYYSREEWEELVKIKDRKRKRGADGSKSGDRGGRVKKSKP